MDIEGQEDRRPDYGLKAVPLQRLLTTPTVWSRLDAQFLEYCLLHLRAQPT